MTGICGIPDPLNGPITNWNVAPFSFSRSEYGPAESYIKTDGILLMGLEQLGRVLHPFLAVEAEGFTSAVVAGGGTPVIQSNNVPGGTPTSDRLNGGQSVVGLVSGDQLSFNGLVPPEPAPLTVPTMTYRYRTRLRVSNSGSAAASITIVITQGSSSTTKTFNAVPTTGSVHEYAVVDDGSGFSLPLSSGSNFSFTCTIGSSAGPCAIDDVVFESDGNGV